jgi:MFS family permease
MSTQDEAARSSRGVLLMLLIAQTMAVMDNAIVAVATKTIRDDLHTNDASLQLILSGYTLTFAVLVVTGARLGAGLGHRRMFLTGVVGFTLASLLCGLAPNPAVLVAGRVVQGAFGALMVPQVLSLIQIIFSGPARARAIGLYSMVLALGVAVGQIVGGLVVNANVFGVGWRAAFLLNLPLGIILLVAAPSRLPGHERGSTFKVDTYGIALLTASMAAVAAPLIFGREAGWPLWIFAILIAGSAGLAGFLWYEGWLGGRGGQPVLDVDALRPAGVKPGLVACYILNFAFAGVVFPMTLHMQDGLRYSPLQAGLAFVAMPIGFASVSLTWTRLPSRYHAVLPLVGLVAFAVATAGLGTVARTGWSMPLIAACLVLAGAGMAAGFSTLVEQAAASVGPKHASSMSALVTTGSLLASVISVAGIGGVYRASAEGGGLAGSARGMSNALFVVCAVLALGFILAVRTWRVAQAQHAAEAALGSAVEQAASA